MRRLLPVIHSEIGQVAGRKPVAATSQKFRRLTAARAGNKPRGPPAER